MRKGFFLFLIFFFALPQIASAHEAYVLTHREFEQGLQTISANPLMPLVSPTQIGNFLIISIVVVIVYIVSFLFATTTLAQKLDKFIKKADVIGPLIIRLAISTSFFFAATTNSILGPELSLSLVPYGNIVRIILFALSLMVFFGFLTEFAALIGIVIFLFVTTVFGQYMITYMNYFGELIVLLLFGSRFLSVDLFLFGKKAWNKGIQKLRNLEIPIVRILYGTALMYAGLTIKFVHQSLSIAVYNQYHLINFFHAPAAFIAAGAGLAELSIGLFIFLGLGQRLTLFISLIFITLSLLYFREMLWPHLMLYGISISLFINSADQFTFDRYFVSYLRKMLWKKRK